MGSMPRPQESFELLLTADEVAVILKVSKDWVWDHSSRLLSPVRLFQRQVTIVDEPFESDRAIPYHFFPRRRTQPF